MFSLHIDTARTWRGGQNQVLLTVLGLRAQGHRTILVAHGAGELRQRAGAHSAPARERRGAKGPPHATEPGCAAEPHVSLEGPDLIPLAPRTEVDLRAAWRLSRLLRRLRPQIVHAHDPHAVAMAALALSMSTAASNPPLLAARRVDFHLKGNALSRWKYRQVDCFVCASEAIRRMVISDGIPEARAVTVYEGIDIDRAAAARPAALHAEFWLPHHAPIIGNVAALVPHKGQRHLIDAAALVIQKVPDARFIIAGEGELRQPLERQIKERRLERHVFLAGFRPDVLSVHKALDLFVMSSVTEGLGSSLLDAMACEKAVVATTAGGIPEAVVDGETGLLVPPRDPEALARAIVTLLSDEPRRRMMGAAGLRRVRERFSVERMVRDTVDLYEAVAGNGDNRHFL